MGWTMRYLNKLYYENKNIYENTYAGRFGFEETLRTGLFIKPFGHDTTLELYFVFNKDTAKWMDQIRKNDDILRRLEEDLPGIAKNSFLIDIISSELKSSNDLEGVESSKEELVETTRSHLLSKGTREGRFASMANSYVLLYQDGALSCPEDLEDVRTIYDRITSGEIDKRDLPDGDLFRKSHVYVKKRGAVDGEIIHEGVYGERRIQDHLVKWLSFLKNEDLSLLVRVAIGHYYFGYIHPFYDGNGRAGRFISSMYLRKEFNYLTAMSLARGSWIKRTKYYKAFQIANAAISKGEMNYFIDEFLKILIAGQEDIIDSLGGKIGQLKEADEWIQNEEKINTKLKKAILYVLAQNYYFDGNSGLKREDIIGYTQGLANPYRIKMELGELNKEGFIDLVKKRPLVYVLGQSFIGKNVLSQDRAE